MNKLTPEIPFSDKPFLRPGRYLTSAQTLTDADVGTIGMFSLSYSNFGATPYINRHGNHTFTYFGSTLNGSAGHHISKSASNAQYIYDSGDPDSVPNTPFCGIYIYIGQKKGARYA